jgi:hypothetical protein
METPGSQLLAPKDGIELADELHGDLLLAKVVVRLDDEGHQPPSGQAAVGGGGPQLALAAAVT